MTNLLEHIILFFLILCAVAAPSCKRLLNCVLMFAAFSTVAALAYLTLQSPDLAITEAAVGAGVETVLFLLALKNIHFLDGTRDKHHDR